MSDEREQPIIRDKRRIDPLTGELRDGVEEVPLTPQADAGEQAESGDAGLAGGVGEAGEFGQAGEAGQAQEGEQQDDVAGQLADELARAKADYFNLDQRFNNFVKRSREEATAARGQGRADVVEALMPMLDEVALARQHGELEGPMAAIAEKLENTLEGKFGAQRFGEVGEEFDPNIHEALMHSTSPDVEQNQIQQVIQPGYRVGERIVRPARVAVVGPEG